jgi:hypothetical protein
MRKVVPRTMSANVYGRYRRNINNLVGNEQQDLKKEIAQQDLIIE